MSRILTSPAKPFTVSRQRLVLLVAFATVLVEIARLGGVLPAINVGRIVVSTSIVPGVGVLVLLGRRAWGRVTDAQAAEVFWVTAVVGLLFGLAMLSDAGHLVDGLGIVIAALDEEIVYRFAVPTVIAATLLHWRVPASPARFLGYAAGALWFVLLPGHRIQVDGAVEVLPFVAFATLAAIVVARSGSIYVVAMAHTVMNMLTISALDGQISRGARGVATAALLILLVTGYGYTRRHFTPAAARQAPDIDLTRPVDGTVIDLRDGVAPTVAGPDGAAEPVLPVAHPADDAPSDAPH